MNQDTSAVPAILQLGNTQDVTNCFVRRETNRTGNTKKELTVARLQANKQGRVKMLMGVNQPQGTSH